ncbi:hypothetical protein AC578_7240 [Pseudocercospora eumusae]|uniref:Uncharacterized protein n=1 Tax=Pseudocercospora eumusae TaxID=321146 RepID=A0A139HWV8_9PEZI|nr:hypothetical protein AC578_7240 [Pseudocercospora eumusae]
MLAHELSERQCIPQPPINITLAPLFLRTAELYGSCTTAEVPIHFFIDHIEDPLKSQLARLFRICGCIKALDLTTPSLQSLSQALIYEPDKVINAGMVPVLQKYWTSCARTGRDVNALKAKGAPIWKAFDDGKERMQADLVAFWKTVKTELGHLVRARLRQCIHRSSQPSTCLKKIRITTLPTSVSLEHHEIQLSHFRVQLNADD